MATELGCSGLLERRCRWQAVAALRRMPGPGALVDAADVAVTPHLASVGGPLQAGPAPVQV
jgi:hypothetical protein